MTITTSDTRINELVINKLTRAQYEAALQAGTISETEFYAVTDEDTYVDTETFTNAMAEKQNVINASNKLEAEYVANLANVAYSGEYSDLLNKPTLSTVAGTGEYSDLLNKPTLSTVAGTGEYADLLNKPELANVATSGDYADLTNKPELADIALSGEYSDLVNAPVLANVATSGDYADLTNKPTVDQTYNGSSANAQSGTAIAGMIANYSTTDSFANVAFSGDFADLTNVPAAATVDQTYNGSSTNAQSGTAVAGLIANYMTSDEVTNAISNAISTVYKYKGSVATYEDLPSSGQQVGDVWNVESDGHNYAWTGTEWDRLAGTVDLSNYVTTNGAQTLTNKTISVADNTLVGFATVATSGEYSDLANKPTLSTVAGTGEYSDLLNKPTVDQTYNASSANAQSGVAIANLIANYSTTDAFSNVAFSGEYSDLVNAPVLANVATSGDYADLTNTPTIPTIDQVWNASSTNAQSGVAIASAIANMQETTNMVDTISNTSTNTTYPTASAVYNATANLAGVVFRDWSGS